MLDGLRQLLDTNLHLLLPGIHADLVSGMVLGQNNFPPQFYEQLKATGLVHVVVVSGYNISIVTRIVLDLLKNYPKLVRVITAFAVIIVYILLTGASPPSVRAGIMGVIALSAAIFGRESWSLYALGLSAFVMLFFDPSLIENLSFQLSFAATAGIIFFEKSFFETIKFKLPFIFKKDLSTSLAAQVFVLPLIAYNFGQISLIAPLANMLSLWLVPLITYLGFIIIFVSLVFLPLAALIGWVTYVFTFSFMMLVNFFASVPMASIYLDRKQLYLSLILMVAALLLSIKVRLAVAKELSKSNHDQRTNKAKFNQGS